ncbi:MAG TPA: pyridoxamine 5'-phosphate oxidase [Acidimicrobiales bacterium]|nr:pyridoxamine 5'-phosphate oxidase [Acidimicrobiales bacterium]
MELNELRAEYERTRFDVADGDADPYVQFRRWYDAVVAAGYVEPWAMVLATVSPDGWPSARNVLLRGLSPDGFDFYTNYTSDKARDLEDNGRATAVFSWNLVHRQVRITGTASRVPEAESEAYFASRPRGAQISAWASDQSRVLADREMLVRYHEEIDERFVDTDVPRPPWWGGYRIVPHVYEFWQGREDRLHDRLRYTREGPDAGHDKPPAARWRIERLAP